jgi:hypothetical protein
MAKPESLLVCYSARQSAGFSRYQLQWTGMLLCQFHYSSNCIIIKNVEAIAYSVYHLANGFLLAHDSIVSGTIPLEFSSRIELRR